MGCSQSKAAAGTAVGTVSSKAGGLIDSGTSTAATKVLKETAPASPPEVMRALHPEARREARRPLLKTTIRSIPLRRLTSVSGA